MYATYLSIEGLISDGASEVEKTKFKSLEELQQTIKAIKVKITYNRSKRIVYEIKFGDIAVM